MRLMIRFTRRWTGGFCGPKVKRRSINHCWLQFTLSDWKPVSFSCFHLLTHCSRSRDCEGDLGDLRVSMQIPELQLSWFKVDFKLEQLEEQQEKWDLRVQRRLERRRETDESGGDSELEETIGCRMDTETTFPTEVFHGWSLQRFSVGHCTCGWGN